MSNLGRYSEVVGLWLQGLALVVLMTAAGATRAGEPLSDSDLGRRVMVDYIVHFAHHLQWPLEVFNGTSAPFRICVMGDDDLVGPLQERFYRHRVQGRMAALEKVESDELMQARRCQIIVLDGVDSTSLLQAVAALEFFPVLTVSDADRFTVLGGMIQFTGNGRDMALQLNKTRLDRAELKMGSSMFRLTRQLK